MAFTSNREDELLLARLEDLCKSAEKRYQPCFMGFLDERQQGLCSDALKYRGVAYRFYGGYEGAERTFLGVSPEEPIPDGEFPLGCVQLRYRECETLTHRDVLGSLMGLNIRRDAVGDISVSAGCAWIFLAKPVLPVVVGELSKVGRSGVRCREVPCGEATVERSFEEISGTVSSLRLDCAVAFLGRLSRGEAAQLIASGKVALDGLPEENGARQLPEGCRVSIRGVGKFIYDGQNGFSKKNKLRVTFRKHI